MDDQFKKFWAPLATILGAVLLIFQLAQAFTGNRTLVTGLLILVSLIAIGAGMWSYSFKSSSVPGLITQSQSIARSILLIIFIAIVISIIYLLSILEVVPDCCGFVSMPTSAPMQTPSYTASPTYVLSPIPNFTSTSPSTTTIFEDPFIDNQNNWYTESTFPNITGGKYTHKLSCPTEYQSFYCGTYLIVPFTFPGNFQMEIDVTVLESSPGANVGFGFQVRRSNVDHYYINYFLTDGLYTIAVAYKGSTFEIIPMTSMDTIAMQLPTTYRLGVEIQDSTFTPIINGLRQLQGEDGNLPNSGNSYLVLFVSRGHSATLQLDNLQVQEVN